MVRKNKSRITVRSNFHRKQNIQIPRERILIVSEGSKTEPLYFNEIRATYRLPTANIAILPSEWGTCPRKVVEYAEHLFIHGDFHRQIEPMEKSFLQMFTS